MKNSRKILNTSLVIIVIGTLFLGVLIFYPFIHNHYLHPLGQLRHSISVGQPYDDVERLFDDYIVNRRGETDLQNSKGETTRHLFKGPIDRKKELFIYDLSLFDDLQLQVLFGEDNLVEEINFIGD